MRRRKHPLAQSLVSKFCSQQKCSKTTTRLLRSCTYFLRGNFQKAQALHDNQSRKRSGLGCVYMGLCSGSILATLYTKVKVEGDCQFLLAQTYRLSANLQSLLLRSMVVTYLCFSFLVPSFFIFVSQYLCPNDKRVVWLALLPKHMGWKQIVGGHVWSWFLQGSFLFTLLHVWLLYRSILQDTCMCTFTAKQPVKCYSMLYGCSGIIMPSEWRNTLHLNWPLRLPFLIWSG